MQKLDRLVWAAGVSIQTFGLRVGVRVSDSAVMDRVLERLPPGWEPGCGPIVDHLYSLKIGGPVARGRAYTLLHYGLQQLVRTMDLDDALEALEGHLQWQVATLAPLRVFVHAGVVGWRGRAVLLPGYCMAGKSTLVAELLRHGATYYSDEYAVLDGRGLVHPYPRRLSLRQGADRPNLRCGPGAYGAEAGVRPLPVGLIALARHRPGARWQPRAVRPGEAALQLLECTLTAEREPEAALCVLNRVAAGARCLKGVRGEAAETAAAILRATDSVDAPPPARMFAA